MAEITVHAELVKEDRARLDELIGLLSEVVVTLRGLACAQVVSEHPADAVPPATVQDVVPEEAPAAAPAEPVVVYKQEDVRKAVMSACSKGADVKAKVKAILNEYAESVPKLKPEHFGEFLGRLKQEGLA